jgi:hypothetical protein
LSPPAAPHAVSPKDAPHDIKRSRTKMRGELLLGLPDQLLHVEPLRELARGNFLAHVRLDDGNLHAHEKPSAPSRPISSHPRTCLGRLFKLLDRLAEPRYVQDLPSRPSAIIAAELTAIRAPGSC